MTEYRTEKDFLGELKVPKSAYWGAQTQRAIENFPISGVPISRHSDLVIALAAVKQAAAEANAQLGQLDTDIAEAIAPVHEGGVLVRHAHQWRGAAGEHGRGGTKQIHQGARIAHRMAQSHIAGGDAQARDIGMGMRHQDRQRVIHARVGIDQQLRSGHGRR